ncbi:hypothetical protein ACQEU3_47260 [Spirillospora sp. CA-253888]
MTAIQEVALTESRALRNQYADRTEALDKVKALSLLPDGAHVTTEMIATYYEVGVEAIKSLAKDNADELAANGRRVLEGEELRSFKDLCGIPSRAKELAVFSRRAILNVGQLLRDSEVARQVRTYLLDAEAAPTTGREMSRLELIDLAREAELERIKEAARADHFEQRAAAAEGTVREIEGAQGLTLRVFHKKYFSEVREREFFEHLYSKGYLIDQRGKGGTRPDGTIRHGAQHRHPAAKGKPYLYFHFTGIHGDKRRENTRVRPGQPELDFKAVLVREGLPSNDGDDGFLFAITGGE